MDMYRFPHTIEGTAFATMELIEPDGSGPQPSRIGTYELVAFTRREIDDNEQGQFSIIEMHIRNILTSVSRYSYHAELNPLDTCEVPADDDSDPNLCLVFDEWRRPRVPFRIGKRSHGLLLCIEIFRSEMGYAMRYGSKALLKHLKDGGHYPYSDLDREPVV